ncbi:MAG: ROK family protein [Clostridia bacterium]|nr:ROK family protein [Clostridia bacterium]
MYYLGIDIGGTKCAVSLGEDVGKDFAVLAKVKFPTAGKKPNEVLDIFLSESEKLIASHSLKFSDIAGLGISCGGPLDAKKGIIMSPPNLPGWDDIHVTEFFEKHTGIPSKLQNDANACAVAEWLFGAGKGCDNVVFLTFGTGLGAGLILDGHLYSGTNDMAGEIGHVRLTEGGPIGYGKFGSCEGYCSGGGIAQLGKIAVTEALARGEKPRLLDAAGSIDAIDAKVIGDLAEKENDEFCLEIYRKCGEKLGITLSILVDILNPERIILGGVFMRSHGIIVPAMEKVMKNECLSYALDVCKVVPAGLGEHIGDYAALSLATLAAKGE